jgi:hypothetical protein
VAAAFDEERRPSSWSTFLPVFTHNNKDNMTDGPFDTIIIIGAAKTNLLVILSNGLWLQQEVQVSLFANPAAS